QEKFPLVSDVTVEQLFNPVTVSAEPEMVPFTSNADFGVAVPIPTLLFVPSYTRPFASTTRRLPVEDPARLLMTTAPEDSRRFCAWKMRPDAVPIISRARPASGDAV